MQSHIASVSSKPKNDVPIGIAMIRAGHKTIVIKDIHDLAAPLAEAWKHDQALTGGISLVKHTGSAYVSMVVRVALWKFEAALMGGLVLTKEQWERYADEFVKKQQSAAATTSIDIASSNVAAINNVIGETIHRALHLRKDVITVRNYKAKPNTYNRFLAIMIALVWCLDNEHLLDR